MHVMIRSYSGKGAAELAKLLVARRSEVEKLMKGIPGFVSYAIVETGEGCFSVTTCKDKAGVDRSLAEAKDWLKANAGHLGLAAPQVSEGKSVVHFDAKAAMPA